MGMKGRGAAKILLIILTVAVMFSCMIIPASAADSAYVTDGNGTLTAIELKELETRDVLQIPDGVTTISSAVVKEGKIKTGIFSSTAVKATEVKEIVIPASVKSIKSGAFSNCTSLTKVTVDNYKDSVSVESGAFPDNVPVVYKERPVTLTQAPTPTQPPVTVTQPPATEAPTRVTTTRRAVTTTEEPTTEETTTAAVVEISELTPFADAKEQLNDMKIWEELVNQSTEPASQPAAISDATATTMSYAAVVLVAFSAVVLGYMKFKK